MSFDTCLQQALESAKITAAKAGDALYSYNTLTEHFERQGMAPDQARLAAAQETVTRVEAALRDKKRVQMVQTLKVASLLDQLENFRTASGKADMGQGLLELMEWNGNARFTNVVARQNRVRGQLHAKMESVLEKFRPRAAGIVHPKAGMDRVVREIFGEATGDTSARELAAAWKDAAKMARDKFIAAGGRMGELENWHLPQKQDRLRVRKAGRDKWLADHMNWLDWGRMRHPDTGLPIAPGEREDVLKYVYATLVSDGNVRIEPGQQGVKALGNRIDQHRFLVYKSADSWQQMHRAYAGGDVFGAMVSHIDLMSRDIALMEVLGPNPNATKEFLKQAVLRRAGERDAANPNPTKGRPLDDKAKQQIKKFDDLYDTALHVNNGSIHDPWANSFEALRNLITSAYLGTASIAAVAGDLATTGVTSAFNRTSGAGAVKQYAKMLNPLSSADRRLAVRSGLIAESASGIATGASRYLGEVLGPQWSRRIADSVLRASLLTPHTQAIRWAFGMELMGGFADHAGKGFDALPFKDMLARHGITAADWDALRAVAPYEHGGAKFLRPDDLRGNPAVADKFMDLIFMEREFAAPTSSLRARTFLVGPTRPDTFIGQIARSVAMFRNFPVTVILLHGNRMVQRGSMGSKLAYGAGFFGAMTMAGALTVQMRQIAMGKDPMEMEDPKFWGMASLQGGGLGIFGDFLFSGLNRFGAGLPETAAGAPISMIGETLNLTLGNLVQIANGEDPKFAADAVQWARRNLPGQSLWYARLALQRKVWDQLLLEADPGAYSKFSRQESRLYRETGQEFWWRPGETEPRRAPDLEAALP